MKGLTSKIQAANPAAWNGGLIWFAVLVAFIPAIMQAAAWVVALSLGLVAFAMSKTVQVKGLFGILLWLGFGLALIGGVQTWVAPVVNQFAPTTNRIAAPVVAMLPSFAGSVLDLLWGFVQAVADAIR